MPVTPPTTIRDPPTLSELPPRGPDAPILVVDDNPAKRLAIGAIIEPLGHPVVEAESGEAALKAVIDQSFAVILMDVQMPAMDGYETARLIRLRVESQHTPIIFVTAHTEEEAQLAIAYASGAVDFIFAPILPDILRAKITIFADLFSKSQALGQSIDDVTRLRDRFRDSEARTRSVLDNVADGIVTVADDGAIESFNPAATELFGYEEEDAVGRPFTDLVSSGVGVASGHRKDGSSFPIELDVRHVELGTGGVQIACLRNIAERQTYVEALKYQALHDDLTDLPNRALFEDRVNHAIQSASRTGDELALLLLDLDGFKVVNDTLGHQHGDTLLKQVGERLVECLRDGDTVARIGGDEFGILPQPGIGLSAAAAVAWKIERALAVPFVIEGNELDIGASIGIALVPEHGNNIDDLLRRADLAMYDAKRSGAGYAVFAAEQEEAPARRLALLSDLRHCVRRDELVLHYQPKIDLRTRRTIGVEALIRWRHPSGELLMPAAFMPEVESNELLMPITEWVIAEALHQLRAWRDDGFDLTMAVNIGARCLAEGAALFETADALTSKWGVPADKLTFELTESALIDTSVPGLVERLKGMNERLSIDDFGTGYSSLVYLQKLPVVEIKADRSFVTTLSTVHDDAVIVHSIVDLAHNLGVTVVAEGVEDETTLNSLVEYGCDTAQGFFFSRPVSGDEATRWFESSEFGIDRSLVKPEPRGALA
ncbi:MAG TPA: EAL domain-containing protein [Thermoleophilaceae bacterium]|nr:EAL domain-containing protein [Thermoleophilaceae bacterium]